MSLLAVPFAVFQNPIALVIAVVVGWIAYMFAIRRRIG